MGSEVGNVRVCRVCGHINPAEGAERCTNCWSSSALATVPETVGEELVRRRRFLQKRSRLSRLALAGALAIGLILWGTHAFFGVGSLILPPPSATTSLSAILGPQTWAQGRRTPQSTGFTPNPAPLPGQVKWTFASAKPLVTTPAVVDDRMYLTTEDGRTIALDRGTGRPVWEYRTGSPSSSTPAVTKALVIFATRPGRVVALDRETGTLRWERDIESPVLASPVVANGTVYLGAADNNLYALDVANGKQRWAFATKAWVTEAVAYAGDTVVVTSQNSVINILDGKTGRRRHVYDTGRRRNLIGGPAIPGDLAFFGSHDGTVWAIDRQAKTYPFERAILYWRTNMYVWGVTSNPPLQKGSVWAKRIASDLAKTPAVAHGMVYAADKHGKVVALDAATGKQRWSTDLGVPITAAPTVAGETVLIGTKDGRVFALGAGTGATMWDFKTGGEITGSPIVAGDTLYVVSQDGKLYAVGGSQ